mgnify:CR=1 FL=1
MDFEANSGEETNRPVIYCSDCEKFIMLIMEDTCIVDDVEGHCPNYSVKVGIDGGGQSLKIMVQAW